MYSQTRLYSDCMLSGALQKYSGVSKTVLKRLTAARWRKTLPINFAISFLLIATFPATIPGVFSAPKIAESAICSLYIKLLCQGSDYKAQ